MIKPDICKTHGIDDRAALTVANRGVCANRLAGDVSDHRPIDRAGIARAALLEHLAEVLQGRAQGVHVEGVAARAAEAGAEGIASGAVVVATDAEAERQVSAHEFTIRGKTKEGRP